MHITDRNKGLIEQLKTIIVVERNEGTNYKALAKMLNVQRQYISTLMSVNYDEVPMTFIETLLNHYNIKYGYERLENGCMTLTDQA